MTHLKVKVDNFALVCLLERWLLGHEAVGVVLWAALRTATASHVATDVLVDVGPLVYDLAAIGALLKKRCRLPCYNG